MKSRCDNSRLASHGGRGITYDPRWKDFEAFLADVGERPVGKTLDRINVMGHYVKSNCRWASDIEQANNQRRSKKLYYDFDNYGPEGTPAEWARFLRITAKDPKWTVKHLNIVMKTLSLDQIVGAVHPQRLTPRELEERERKARETAEQKRVSAIIDAMLNGAPPVD